ncbi:methyltransferase, partial [Candidatus Nitromaritima sp. SCGC AAA799-C22]
MAESQIHSAYLAAEDFQSQLLTEVGGVVAVHDRLVLSSDPPIEALWAQNIWRDPVIIPIESINDGAKKLKAIQRNWCLYSCQLHRRAKLIEEKLPHVSAKPLKFPCPLPPSALGSWTLLNENTILASPTCSSLFPNGEMNFEEDREGPPSRAYLKLYEALTLMQKFPQAGEFCIDAGGSP